MWYNDLRPSRELIPNKYSLVFYEKALLLSESAKKRTLNNLIALKNGLAMKVPKKEVDRNILLASWNVKEFGHLGERLPEAYFYIAEIINAFDIVAIQEIKRSLYDLDLVMKILGSHWSYLITDITEGASGNKERFGYIYDTRRVRHSGLSGELVVPEEFVDPLHRVSQLKRTPSITGFECGWKKFAAVGLHLHPGNDEDDKALRKEELRLLMEVYKEKVRKKHLWNENMILLGDTNLYNDNHDIVSLVTQEGFKECESLIGVPTNTSQTECYDRIFMKTDAYFKLRKNGDNKESGGVFPLYDYVFTDDASAEYHAMMLAHKNDPSTLTDDQAFHSYFHRYWKRNQVSDHLPVWIEIEEDSSKDFLQSKFDKI